MPQFRAYSQFGACRMPRRFARLIAVERSSRRACGRAIPYCGCGGGGVGCCGIPQSGQPLIGESGILPKIAVIAKAESYGKVYDWHPTDKFGMKIAMSYGLFFHMSVGLKTRNPKLPSGSSAARQLGSQSAVVSELDGGTSRQGIAGPVAAP